jgi:PAS domain S-box-containing protein
LRSKVYSIGFFFISLLVAFFLWTGENEEYKGKSKRFFSYISDRIQNNADHFFHSNYRNIENYLDLVADQSIDSLNLMRIYSLLKINTSLNELEKIQLIEEKEGYYSIWELSDKGTISYSKNLDKNASSDYKQIAYDQDLDAIVFKFKSGNKDIFFLYNTQKVIQLISNEEQRSLVNFDFYINNKLINDQTIKDSSDVITSELVLWNSELKLNFSPKKSYESYVNSFNANFIFLIVSLFGTIISILLFIFIDREKSRKKISKEYHQNENGLIGFYKIISENSTDLMKKIEAILDFICTELDSELGIVSEANGSSYQLFCVNPDYKDFKLPDIFQTKDTFCQFTIDKGNFFSVLDATESEYKEMFTYKEYGFKSYIGFPIIIDSNIFGSLCFLGKNKKTREFNNYEKNLIKLGAQWISSTLKNHFTSVKSKGYYENFQKIFNLNKNGILVNNGERILEVNDGFCSITGFSREKLIGKSIYETIHPEEIAFVKKKIKNDYIGTYETRGLKSDGSEYIIEINVQKFLYENKPARLAFIHDITFQKQYENALTESKQFLLEILNSISDSISVHDNQGNTIIANKSYYEQESINKNLFNVNNQVDHEEYISTDQKERRTFHSKNTRLETETGKIYYVTISRDITDITKAEQNLLESEQLFKNVIESLNEGLLLVDKEGYIIYGNKQLENITGYSPDEITFQNSYELFFEDNDFSINEVLKDQEIKKRELEIRQKNHQKIWVELSLIPIHEADGEEIGLLMAIMDIQTRKEAEIELLKSLKEKEFLLKEVHHRVKNNLQVISSLLNLQHSYIDDPFYKSIFKESQNRVRSMALIHEKLYQNEYFSQIDIQHYIYSLTSNLKNSYSSESQRVQFLFDIDNIFLSIDQAIPCGLILNELISNSLKYAFNEVTNGTISISFKLDAKHNALLFMEDNGKGFPEDFNVEKSETLGLKIVQTLAEQINASIHIKSENGVKIRIEFKIENLEETDVLT